jgi:CoA:oxalate CoA-transferase
MDKLGVGASVLMADNPRLIYASATGYGLSGPERDNLAMDITIQAASGAISVTGFADGPPVKAGPAIADFLSGTHLYGAIVTALYERERTGRGRMIEVAMIETMFPTLASNLGMIHNNPDRSLGRTGNRHGGLAVSPYNVYACKDGWFAIICTNEEHWRSLCAAMGRPELADDPRFVTNAARVTHMEETDAVVEAWAAALSRDRRASRTFGAGARPLRSAEQRAHEDARHARGNRSSSTRADHRAWQSPAVPRHPSDSRHAKSRHWPGQRGGLRRVARAYRRRRRGASARRCSMKSSIADWTRRYAGGENERHNPREGAGLQTGQVT